MGGALLTDLYELNMAASYLRRDMSGVAVFSLFIRELPPTRGSRAPPSTCAPASGGCATWSARSPPKVRTLVRPNAGGTAGS